MSVNSVKEKHPETNQSTSKRKSKVSSNALTTPSTTMQNHSEKPSAEAGSNESELCFICAEAITVYAVGGCNHRVCHICSLRLRALYKSRSCAYCKTQLAEVVFTLDSEKEFDKYDLAKLPYSDKRLSIFCENADIYQDLLVLLRFNCPDDKCDVSCPEGWASLKRHVREVHNKVMCDLCTRNKKVFTHEHSLYTQQQLQKHIKYGDPNDLSFKGHPECGFCSMNFYDSDQLYDHCKQQHEQCFLCVRAGIRHQYYVNYQSLENHFKNDHYYCRHSVCMEKKFVVFASDIDYKAHEMEEHQDGGKKKPMQVETNFTYVSRPTIGNRENQRSDRSGRGNQEQERQSNTDSIINTQNFPRLGSSRGEMSSTLPIPGVRNEQNDFPNLGAPENATSKLTHGKLRPQTSSSSRYDRPSVLQNRVKVPPPSGATEVLPARSMQNKAKPPPGFGTQLTDSSQQKPDPTLTPAPNEPELQIKIRELFQNNMGNFSEFKNLTAGYRRDTVNISQLFGAFKSFAMQDRIGKVEKKEAEAQISKLWQRMADTLPEDVEAKKEEMLVVLNDWKVQVSQENSTALKPKQTVWASSSTLGSPSSAKVLVIKSKTAKSRAGLNRDKTTWNSTASPSNLSPVVKTLRTMTTTDNSSSAVTSVWGDESTNLQNLFPALPINSSGEEGEIIDGGKKKGKKGKKVLMHFG